MYSAILCNFWLAVSFVSQISKGHDHGSHADVKYDQSLSGNPSTIDPIPISTRMYWMRRANAALGELGSPCPFAAFSTVIVNHTDAESLGEEICIGINSNAATGNPTLHGEMAAINNCTSILTGPRFNLSPAEALAAFHNLTLYTNAESCPMCAAAIRWAGLREYVYGTSISWLTQRGWGQIQISSAEVFYRSADLPTKTKIIAHVLANETDPYFGWQFNDTAACPPGCSRLQ